MDELNVRNKDQFEIIDCPVCDSTDYKTVYKCQQETGYTLGKIKTSFVICDVCGFMYQNPRPKLELLLKHYSESEEASGSVYHDVKEGSSHHDKQKSRSTYFLKYFDKITNGSLLEVGCSTGDFLVSLGLTQWNLVGLEPSVKAANQAKDNGLNVICSSLEDSNLKGETFDAVCCFSVLEHMHDINAAISNMTNALKIGGILCLEVPDTMKPVPQLAEFFTFEHMSHFTKEVLSFFLAGYGYSDFKYDDTGNDARLRVAAKKSRNSPQDKTKNLYNYKKSLESARNLLFAKVDNYKEVKNKLERNILERLSSYVQNWKNENKQIAIYGAGVHTRYLLNLFDISDNVTSIIDSDPQKHGKRFLRWTIYDESLLASGKIDAVIISSKAFEDEIYNRIECYAHDSDLEIVRCYSNDL
jgi:SAM-dependent methyltransferase